MSWAQSKIREAYSFDLFSLLVDRNKRIEKDIIEQTKVFLHKSIQSSPVPKGIQRYPKNDQFKELCDVGYWCLCGFLQSKDFEEFLGCNEKFDFYIQYDSYDFSKFDVAWLYDLQPHAHRKIAENETVKCKAQTCIVRELSAQKLKPQTEEALRNILVNYYCN